MLRHVDLRMSGWPCGEPRRAQQLECRAEDPTDLPRGEVRQLDREAVERLLALLSVVSRPPDRVAVRLSSKPKRRSTKNPGAPCGLHLRRCRPCGAWAAGRGPSPGAPAEGSAVTPGALAELNGVQGLHGRWDPKRCPLRKPLSL